jgi:hypothetical protein
METSAELDAMRRELVELRATVARLSAMADAPAPEPPRSRRDLLKLGAGVAAGAAGTLLLSAGPAAANNLSSLTVGAQQTPTANTTPTSGIDYAGAGVYNHAVFAVTDNAAMVGAPAAIVGGGATKARNGVIGIGGTAGVAGLGNLYDLVAVGSGITGRTPFMHKGPPTTDQWVIGDVILDELGNLFVCVVSGTPGKWRKLAGPASAGAFHAISPERVYDSRTGGGKLADGVERIVSVVGPNPGAPVVEPNATAVAITLTVTETEGVGGFLAVRPAGTPYRGTSSVNWFGPNQNLACTVISKLGGDRQLTVRGGAQPTHFLVDVTGYYL